MADAVKETTGLEQRLSRLEAIVDALERDELELDDALALFEEGVAHVRAAREILASGEVRIERLLDDGAGGAELAPGDGSPSGTADDDEAGGG